MKQFLFLIFFLVVICSLSSLQKQNEDLFEIENSLSELTIIKKDNITIPPLPCNDKPFIKIKSDDDESYYKNIFFYAVEGDKTPLFTFNAEFRQGDCNSIQLVLGDYEWQNDTLILYNYWCHQGDPAGKDWGARIAKYYWNCSAKTLTKLDAIIYLENESDEGGYPLSKEEMDCKECVQSREDYKRHTGRNHEARYVIGKEARQLIKITQHFFKAILLDIEESYDCENVGFGCRIWE